jgi:CDP-diacylglycerol--glycerol-3-phosphate 3-phosphatidyltransferase
MDETVTLMNALTTNVPNLLSIGRIVAAPIQLYLAFSGQKTAYLAVLMLALLSDAVDGFIARKLRQTSELGARLDSYGDFATYLSLPLCAWWLWPEIIHDEMPTIVIALASYLCPVSIGYIRFRTLIAFHSRGAKLSAILVGISVLLMMLNGPHWPFRISSLVFLLAGLETIAITFVMTVPKANVPSIFTALAIRREAGIKTGED